LPGLTPAFGSFADSFVDHKFHIHLVSDSTGETLNAMTNAALAQFENVEVMIHPYALVRAQAQLTRALDHIAIMPGIVFFTLANPGLRETLMARCKDIEVRCIDLLEGPVTALRQFLGKTETHKVGRQHEVDQRYLDRIEALNFTIAHDDGQSLDSIDEAEVILTGASRTSKTPTCVYLAIRGIRAANVPLVPSMPAPPQLLAAKQPLIVGLWVSPDRLVQVRRNRLNTMGEMRDSNYVDLDAVRAEIAGTRQLFENQDWPMIDVSRRSIEETAAAVMNLLAERKEAMT
jgi:[pyruvate, water dikinase]-phosphate phosphotransferase / [pyruvate, water dikinase] kinase